MGGLLLDGVVRTSVERYFGLEGVAIPHGTSAFMGVVAAPDDDLLDKIPGVRRVNLATEKLERRVGVAGQPIIIGTVLGVVIGLLAGYEVGESVQLGVQMGAVILLMPMVVKLIMQGLMPIAESARTMLQRRFKNAEFRIGLDPALLLGDPQVVAAGLLFVPLTLLIAVLMPGNEVLPFGDLATIGFFVAMAVGVHRGNIFRTLVSGSIIMAVTLWISSRMVGLQTDLARETELLGEAGKVESLDQTELSRLHSPIGLDLGARTPEETAVSVAAEIVAGRWGGTGKPLTRTSGRIHR